MSRRKKANDEFFTQLKDIEYELKHYKHEFKDKIVYMNSDHPDKSQFWTYFYYNFKYLGLKELWATYMTTDGSPASIFKFDGEQMWEEPLESNGDMLGEECLGILKKADVLVTGPPFSILSKFIHELIDSGADYIIIGSPQMYGMKGMLDEIKRGKMNLGYGRGVTVDFEVPESYSYNFKEGSKFIARRNVTWLTNFEVNRRAEDLILYREYYKNPTYYEKYDNIDMLNIDRVKDIPIDYYDYMGVPIGFIEKWNPEEFDVIGLIYDFKDDDRYPDFKGTGIVNGKRKYTRIVIKRRNDDGE